MARREPKIKKRRQVVLVIVEGQSDQNVLINAISEAFERKYGEDTRVYFAKVIDDSGRCGGDITSRYGVKPEKLQMLMNKLIIMPCLMENSLMPKYVTEIVHIIDTDGVYIDDDRVQYDPDHSKAFYGEDSILTDDPDKIRKRNAEKIANISQLLRFQRAGFDIQNFHDTGMGNKATTKMVHVPYSLYYFSCNLDHVIAHERNLEDTKKVPTADAFWNSTAYDLDAFMEFLRNDPAAIRGKTYDESWSMLQEGSCSLHRLTNINLLLDDISAGADFNNEEAV